jgi:hypothetical protein
MKSRNEVIGKEAEVGKMTKDQTSTLWTFSLYARSPIIITGSGMNPIQHWKRGRL